MSSETLIPAESSAVALIREAIASKADPAQLRELLAVRREWEADEARKAYNAAISEFQREAPIVGKLDKGDKAAYAALDRIWREIRPLLTGLGLSVTWQICEVRAFGDQPLCHLEGALRHKLGHGEKLTFDIPVPDIIKTRDGRAVTNATQAMGSAVTYGKRYATCAALGVVTGEDDDGAGAKEGSGALGEKAINEIADMLDAARGIRDFNEDAFWGWVGVASKKVAEIPVSWHQAVVQKLRAKIVGPKSK